MSKKYTDAREFDIMLYNKKMAEMDVKVPDIPAKATIHRDDIEMVRQRGDDDTDGLCEVSCMITMKSGDSMQVQATYKDVRDWKFPELANN